MNNENLLQLLVELSKNKNLDINNYIEDNPVVNHFKNEIHNLLKDQRDDVYDYINQSIALNEIKKDLDNQVLKILFKITD